MRWTDIAVNLLSSQLAGAIGPTLKHAEAAGVHRVVALASDLAEATALQAIQADYPALKLTAGVHPHHASEWGSDRIDRLVRLMQHPAVIAIGECGLDYFRDYSSREAQREAFEAQLELAVEHNRPLVLHCREAYDDFIPMVARYRDRLPGAVLHCFTGTGEELDAALGLDLHIGITGWICDERRGTELRELVTRIPDNRLLLETDSPYLLPRDLRPKPKHRRNEPANLPHIARTVAQLRSQSEQHLSEVTETNVKQLFQL
ncbi:TatD family hydrolase [Ferrimonas balearica]|uniref:TatD family hydrolase n=1 Tax=Ferrimonas balearica TaxID=44012 RepID=UPI001C9983FE|nr:TatD family hydrolase [Ferrimonas balearica]MBY5922584.1 TatD family hydrolase [Ferrimonas balearica]MBY5995568.1 TatD family hydrolase [Ferrimonas balearica]